MNVRPMGYVPGSAKSHVRSQIGAAPRDGKRENELAKMRVDPWGKFWAKWAEGILEPMDRISEVLFGLIMALTFTLTLGVVTADRIQVRTMLLAALGCNLAWG